MNYYNEHDPKAAAWLRELIKAGLISNGVVDERNIQNVKADELDGYSQCHFFAGIGGWSCALRLAGISDDEPIWTGSCPCQPFSIAGRGLQTADERHLWPDFRNLIGQRRPAKIFGEQVAGADGRKWLAGVSADMEALAYRFAAADLCAAGVQAPHPRQRLYWVADTNECPNIESISRLNESAREDGLQEDFQRVGNAGRRGDESKRDRGKRDGAAEDLQKEARQQRIRITSANGIKNGSGMVQPDRAGRDAGGQATETARYGSSVEPASSAGFWNSFDILYFSDGKQRRVEAGTFPLVAGLPQGVVPSGDCRLEEAQNSPEFRVARLRGYGNSIVPQIACEFVKSYIESL
jgi:DNA (cytosine-5)-methyltransferase 1